MQLVFLEVRPKRSESELLLSLFGVSLPCRAFLPSRSFLFRELSLLFIVIVNADMRVDMRVRNAQLNLNLDRKGGDTGRVHDTVMPNSYGSSLRINQPWVD